MQGGADDMLIIFFTAVYFYVFVRLIDLLFRHTINPVTDILAVVCWVIALVVSVGLAEYTVRKIKENGQK